MIRKKAIKQSVAIKAAPHEVYEALMDSKQHAKFTGALAKISYKVGGKIMAYDGYISGKNLDLKKNKKIVQAWTTSEWPKGHFSKVIFVLKEIKGATRLTFTHTGVPAEHASSISQGWKDYYWKPLKKFLER